MDVEVTIVVPSRGGAKRLPVLLSALAQQDCSDFEVIVVVDGDVDGSARLIESMIAEHKVRLRSVVFPENRGRSAALNAGADLAEGRVLIRCDDDLEPGSDYVSQHIAHHADGVAGVIGLYRNILPETAYARVYGRAADERFRRGALATSPDMQWRYWAGNVSVPIEAHHMIGGYDTGFRTYGWEDVDYGYRLHREGVPVRIVPELTTPHHVAATSTPIRAVRALHSGAAREVFVRKHGSLPLGEGVPDPKGLWNQLVIGGSAVATERNLRVLGSAIDLAASVLPSRIAEKLVALTVECAGLAGVRYPARAKARF